MADARQPARPIEKIATIHQPHYFPWLGLIAKIACSDVFVYLDDVQFEKNGWQNRTRYSTQSGLNYLSLPVRQRGVVSGNKTIDAVELADPAAPGRHWETLRQRYGKSRGWRLIADRLEAILCEPHERLMPLCLATTELTFDVFRLRPAINFSSELCTKGQKGQRVVEIAGAVGATQYLSGTGQRRISIPPRSMKQVSASHFKNLNIQLTPNPQGGNLSPQHLRSSGSSKTPHEQSNHFTHFCLQTNPNRRDVSFDSARVFA